MAESVSTSANPGRSGETIACVGVPALLRDAAFDEIDLMKCDIEGAESDLFRDCHGWIGRVFVDVGGRHQLAGDDVPAARSHDDERRQKLIAHAGTPSG